MSEKAEFDLLDLIALLRARWGLIAGFVVLTCLAALAYVLLARPVYRSTVVMISVSSERSTLGGALSSTLGSLGGLGALAGLNIGGDSAVEEALAVLRSRSFGETFIKDLDLMPRFFPKDWDAEKKQWKSAPGKEPTLAKGFEYFNKRVRSVNQDKRTGLTSLNVDWQDAGEAATWANELASRLNSEMRRRALANSKASIDFLQAALPEAGDVESRSALSRLMEAQIKQRMLATVTEDYAFRIVDRALPADLSRPFKPRRVPILLAAPFLGFAAGAFAVLALHFLRRKP